MGLPDCARWPHSATARSEFRATQQFPTRSAIRPRCRRSRHCVCLCRLRRQHEAAVEIECHGRPKENVMIKLTNLTKTFVAGDVQTAALNRINLGISKGEYVAVTGPSGCGKSTLLNILGMIDGTDSGEYWFEGQNVVGWSEKRLSELRRGRVGFIFQNFNLIDEMSVAENVKLALRYTGLAEEEQNGRVRAILDRLGIAHRANHYPSQLSGGQQQRVAIARALIAQPAILLADEPTGNLDTKNGAEVMDLLRVINGEGTTIIMVTHSLEHAEEASRVVHLLDGAVLSDTLKRPAPETT